MLRLWYGRDPPQHWATVMRKLNLPKRESSHCFHTGSSDIKQWEPRIDCENFEIA